MRVKSILRLGLLLSILGGSFLALAATSQDAPPIATELVIEANKIFVPDLNLEKLQLYTKTFTFNWNNYASLQENQKKVLEIEAILKKTNDLSTLDKDEQVSLGKLLYRLGTYYTHITHEPDAAITKMDLADLLLTTKQDKAWNYNHLAYAYEQRYVKSREAKDRERALYYSNRVIRDLYPNMRNKAVAFSYCVRGLIQNDALNYMQAEINFTHALAIYESLPDGKDDQYARVKNKFADLLLKRNGRTKEAMEILVQLKQYWQTKGYSVANPYAARNLVSLGEACLRAGDTKDAREDLKAAVNIYENVYGIQSQQLIEPYKLLSILYKNIGDKKTATLYEHKASVLHKF